MFTEALSLLTVTAKGAPGMRGNSIASGKCAQKRGRTAGDVRVVVGEGDAEGGRRPY